MAPQYGLGGFDLSSYAKDPYFLATLNSYNPNSRGAQSAAGGYNASTLAALQQAAQTGNVSAPSATTSGATVPSINYATTKPESSNTGLWVTGALGAAALITAGVKGKGNIIKGFGKMFSGLTGKASEAATKVADGATTRLTAVRGEDGVIRYLFPGKTVEKVGTQVEIEAFANSIGMRNVATAERQAFNPVKSVIQDFQFGDYIVSVENGSISKITEKGADVTSKFVAADIDAANKARLEDFQNILKEFGKEKDIDTKVFNGVTNINYANTYGDDILNMTLEGYGKTPKITKFTTLGRYTPDAQEVQAYVPKVGENVLIEVSKKDHLVEGTTITGKWSHKLKDGTVLNFNGKEIESIVTASGEKPKDSFGYTEFLKTKTGVMSKKTNEDVINEFINNLFVKRTEKVPVGATVVTV